jgi:diamine N-acetyltransferase
MMTRVGYTVSDETVLESIRPLWIRLNEYHLRRSRSFRYHYEQMTFEDRKEHFLNLARGGLLRVEIARDPDSGQDIGYCVTSLSAEKNGEIESIFVDEAYRGRQIGTTLARRALEWMQGHGAVRVRVSVAYGNEAALDFYRKSGFEPRMMVLELPGK